MKKFIYLLLIIYFTIFFSSLTVNAESKKFSLDDVKVSDKSYNVGLTKLKVVEDSITNDMFFNKVGDYITYDVVIKNNSNTNYTIRKITDDSNNEYLTYDYSKYTDKVVKAGESINLKIKATYAKKSSEKILSNTPVNFKIVYDDGRLINPETFNNLLHVIIILMIITFITVSIVLNKKPNQKVIVILLCLSIILPIITKASTDIYSFSLNNDISEKTVALLDTGMNVNRRMKEIVTGQTLEWKYSDFDNSYDLFNIETGSGVFALNNLKKFIETDKDHYNTVKSSLTEKNIVSLSESDIPVYIWHENNNVYMYSEADEIILNEDSSYLLYYLSEVDEISFNNFVTSNVKNMEYLFSCCYDNYVDIEMDLSRWDTSNVTNMKWMFFCFGRGANSVIINMDNWDTRNVTNMRGMFHICGQASDKFKLIGISDFNTSNVTNMGFLFSSAGENSAEWDIGKLTNWDVSNVTDMEGLLEYAAYEPKNIDIGDLTNWDVSKAENLSWVFCGFAANASKFYIGDLSNWDVSNATDLSYMFADCGTYSTEWFIGDLSNWDVSNVTDFGSMFDYFGYSTPNWSIGDLSNWNVSNATNMSCMFGRTGSNSSTWYIGDLSNWDVSNVTDMRSMFEEAGRSSSTWSIGNISNWDTRNVEDMGGMFEKAGMNSNNVFNIGTLNIYATEIVDIFVDCPNVKAILNIYSNPSRFVGSYNTGFFNNAATAEGSFIVVNYSSNTRYIDDFLASKSENSNVVKGSLLD